MKVALDKSTFWIYGLVMAIVVFGILLTIVALNSDDKGFSQVFYAKDIALTVTQMMQTDGDVNINYRIEDEFEVKVENGLVTVTKDFVDTKEKYLGHSKYQIDYERKPGTLVLKKTEVLA